MTVSESPKPSCPICSKNNPYFFAAISLLTALVCIGYWGHLGWDRLDSSMSWKRFSETLLDEQRFSTTIAPLTTIYYAAWMAILGRSVTAVRIAALAVFLGINWLVFRNAYRLSGDIRFARLAAFLTSIHPFLVVETTTSGYEILSIFIINLFILRALGYSDNPNWKNAAILGAICGLATLVKVALFSLILIFAIYSAILAVWRKKITHIKYTVATVLISVLIVSIWMERNRRVEGFFSLAAPNYMAETWYHGNNPWATKGIPIFDNDCPPEFWDIRSQIEELENPEIIAKAYREEVRTLIQSDPFHWYFVLGPKKIWCAFKFYSREEILYWGPLLPLAAIGAYTLLRQGIQGIVLHIILFNYALSSYLYFGFSRYRIPYVTILILLACHAVFFLRDRWKPWIYKTCLSLYILLFLGGYSFAKILRVVWHYFLPQLRM